MRIENNLAILFADLTMHEVSQLVSLYRLHEMCIIYM